MQEEGNPTNPKVLFRAYIFGGRVGFGGVFWCTTLSYTCKDLSPVALYLVDVLLPTEPNEKTYLTSALNSEVLAFIYDLQVFRKDVIIFLPFYHVLFPHNFTICLKTLEEHEVQVNC